MTFLLFCCSPPALSDAWSFLGAKATPAQISSYRLGDLIHEVFDKENASEKDADFD